MDNPKELSDLRMFNVPLRKRSTMELTRHAAKVAKVDTSLGIVFGWAMVSKFQGQDYVDLQGHHIPEDVMLKSSADFMAADRIGKEMHDGHQTGTILFAWPMTTDIAEAMGITTKQTGLMIGYKPSDPAILSKFATGEYTGFSIGGSIPQGGLVDA